MLARHVRVYSGGNTFLFNEFLCSVELMQGHSRDLRRLHTERTKVPSSRQYYSPILRTSTRHQATTCFRDESEIRSYEHFINELNTSGAGTMIWTKQIFNMHIADGERITLSMLLTLCGKQQCGDIRDKVFGLFSLISRDPGTLVEFSADYSRTSEEVYSIVLETASILEALQPRKLLEFSTQLKGILMLETSCYIFKETARVFSIVLVELNRPQYRKFLHYETVWSSIFKKYTAEVDEHQCAGSLEWESWAAEKGHSTLAPVKDLHGWLLYIVDRVFKTSTNVQAGQDLSPQKSKMLVELLLLRGLLDFIPPGDALDLFDVQQIFDMVTFLNERKKLSVDLPISNPRDPGDVLSFWASFSEAKYALLQRTGLIDSLDVTEW